MIKKIAQITFFSLVLLLPKRSVQAVTITPSVTAPAANTGRNEFQLLEQNNATANSNPATSSPSTAASLSQTSVKVIVAGITDYTDRLMNINQKISTRLEKLKKAKIKTTQLSTKYNNLNRQLQLLKVEAGKVQNVSAGFLVSSNPQGDYLLLKKQLLITQNALRSTLTNEKEIITEITKYSSISATPTAVIKK